MTPALIGGGMAAPAPTHAGTTQAAPVAIAACTRQDDDSATTTTGTTTSTSSLDGVVAPRASVHLQKQPGQGGGDSGSKGPHRSGPHASSASARQQPCVAPAPPAPSQQQHHSSTGSSPRKPRGNNAAAADPMQPPAQAQAGQASSKRRVLSTCNHNAAVTTGTSSARKQQQHGDDGAAAVVAAFKQQAALVVLSGRGDGGRGAAQPSAVTAARMVCDDDDQAEEQEAGEHDSDEAVEEQQERHAQSLPGEEGNEGSMQLDQADGEEKEEEEEEEERLLQARQEELGSFSGEDDGMEAEPEDLEEEQGDEEDEEQGLGDEEGDEEEEEDEEALDSRCGGSGSGLAAAAGDEGLMLDGMLLPAAAFCRNCTSTLRPERWCALCGHHADDDEGLFDGRPAHVQQRETLEQRGLLAPPPGLAASAGLRASASVGGSSSRGAGGEGQGVPKVALVYDERMEQHEEGAAQPHPERPDRVRAVMARLLSSGLAEQCVRLDCQEASLEQLEAVHTPELMEFVKAMAAGLPPPPSYPLGLLTPDTYVNPHTYLCARLAAGGAAQVAAAVARGEAAHGAAIIRPPGHHAESNLAMGFCFFNNAGVAARAAQAAGARRVLILDFDVHHGNGTQHIFEDDPSVMYMSLHRWDNGQFYPGTGAPDEVGCGAGAGYTVNVAWNGGGLQNADYMLAFDRVLMPIARAYKPDLVITSAGFDAADGDPIGGCRLTPECFGHMTALLKSLAPLVMLLEGGYNLAATARSTEACLSVLLGQAPAPLPGPAAPGRAGVLGVLQALHVQRHFWPALRAAYAELRAALLQEQQQQQAAAAAAVQAQQLEARRPCVAPLAAPPRPAPLPPGAAVAAPLPPSKAAKVEEQRRQALRRRQLAMLVQIRKRARQAWWARHRRLLAAKTARKAAAANPQAASPGGPQSE